jgi:hypothetical protein
MGFLVAGLGYMGVIVLIVVFLIRAIHERSGAEDYGEYIYCSEDIRDSTVMLIVCLLPLPALSLLCWWATHQQAAVPWLVAKIQAFQAVTVFGIFIVGIAAFFIRKHFQTFYGFVEVMFGVLLGGAAVFGINVKTFYGAMAALLASVYVFVRGYSNMIEGASRDSRLESEKQINRMRKWTREFEKKKKQADGVVP